MAKLNCPLLLSVFPTLDPRIPLHYRPNGKRLFVRSLHAWEMRHRIRLETQHLILREWQSSDTDHYLTLSKDIGYTAFSAPGQFAATNESEAFKAIEKRQALWEQSGLGKFPIFLRSTGEFIGTCGIDPYRLNGEDEVELGYRLLLRHWGKGYATEAARAVLTYGFDQLKLRRVIAFALPENPRSLKIIEKLGFRFLSVLEHGGLPHKAFELTSATLSRVPSSAHESGFVRFAILLTKIANRETSPDTVRRHIQHLRQLDERGILVLSGPFTDHPSGLVVVRAKDKAEATSIALSDPFVIEGARTFEVRSWLLACADNNYLE